MVDLNHPDGLKWGKCSIGAKNEYEYGLYFQWGSVDGTTGSNSIKIHTGTFVYNNINVNWRVIQNNAQRDYSWGTTPYCTNNAPKFSKYLGSTDSPYKDPSATDEDALKTTLDSIDDAAVQRLGNGKRMPTATEYLTLKNNTYWQWIDEGTEVRVKVVNSDGTVVSTPIKYPAGYFVFKVKDNSHKGKRNVPIISSQYDYNDYIQPTADVHIFFPASGYANGTLVDSKGSRGYYSSSSLYSESPGSHNFLDFAISSVSPITSESEGRKLGCCIRAVSSN